MTEYQKIAIGLLGMTHPEVQLYTQAGRNEAPQGQGGRTSPWRSLVRATKFAFAALLAGSRSVPLGDNRRLIKELGAYGVRLRR
jgi:hypothetical protein